MNTTRAELTGTGLQTAALAFGGFTPSPPANSTATENYNGSIWTNYPSMATARRALAGTGTQSLGLAFGGNPGSPSSPSNATEEFTGEVATATARTVTTS